MKNIVGAKVKEVYIRVEIIRLFDKRNKTVLLNKKFCCIFFYLILKIFKEYSKVKQWDKTKY